jgi:hypothetical protein
LKLTPPLFLLLVSFTGGGRPVPTGDVAPPIHTQPEARAGGHLPAPSAIELGEGWGCAVFTSEAGSARQCWRAGALGQPVHARPTWTAPDAPHVAGEAGPDRLCVLVGQELRCWHAPRPGEAAPRAWPEAGAWLNPRRLTREQTAHPAYAQQAFVGGSFACLRGDDLWCVGDDGYGQLGAAGAAAGADGPEPLLDLEPVTEVGLGRWHGCARRAGQTLYCWGRGDAGQLGATAPDRCGAGDPQRPIACARRPQRASFALAGMVTGLQAGDLFTCSAGDAGVVCWGAARDGFFGKPSACPAGLRRAWPTRHGPARAPRAACSTTPAAVRAGEQWGARRAKAALPPQPIAGGSEPAEGSGLMVRAPGIFAVGPRGVCVQERDGGGTVTCAGAVPTPRGLAATRVKVSPGDDASACAVSRAGEVLCWGEGYSPAGAPARPVPIVFEEPPPNPDAAVVDYGDPSSAGPSCLIQRGCTLKAARPPPCAPGATAGAATAPSTWAALGGAANQRAGQVVSVIGTLEVGPSIVWGVGCAANECCSKVRAPIVMGGDGSSGGPLAIESMLCSGDETRMCCNLVADGQQVLATGRLIAYDANALDLKWKLADATLCVYNRR